MEELRKLIDSAKRYAIEKVMLAKNDGLGNEECKELYKNEFVSYLEKELHFDDIIDSFDDNDSKLKRICCLLKEHNYMFFNKVFPLFSLFLFFLSSGIQYKEIEEIKTNYTLLSGYGIKPSIDLLLVRLDSLPSFMLGTFIDGYIASFIINYIIKRNNELSKLKVSNTNLEYLISLKNELDINDIRLKEVFYPEDVELTWKTCNRKIRKIDYLKRDTEI